MKQTLTWLLFAAFAAGASAQSMPRTVTVRMVDRSTAEWRFEPASIEVRPGDTVRWVLEDVVPHNVEFKKVPPGADLGDAQVGAFLLTKGEVYELKIDGRFATGPYEYVCTPHAPLGMRGSLAVLPAGTSHTN